MTSARFAGPPCRSRPPQAPQNNQASNLVVYLFGRNMAMLDAGFRLSAATFSDRPGSSQMAKQCRCRAWRRPAGSDMTARPPPRKTPSSERRPRDRLLRSEREDPLCITPFVANCAVKGAKPDRQRASSGRPRRAFVSSNRNRTREPLWRAGLRTELGGHQFPVRFRAVAIVSNR